MKVYIYPVIKPKILKTIESVLTKYNSKLRIKDVQIRLISKSPFNTETNFSLSLNVNPIKAYNSFYNLHPYEDIVIKLQKSLSSALKKYGCKVIHWSTDSSDIDIELTFCKQVDDSED